MSNTANNSNTPGLNCPGCKFAIKFTMDMLLYNNEIRCPACGLQMNMEVPTELKTHLQEIHLAEQMVQKSKNFKR